MAVGGQGHSQLSLEEAVHAIQAEMHALLKAQGRKVHARTRQHMRHHTQPRMLACVELCRLAIPQRELTHTRSPTPSAVLCKPQAQGVPPVHKH